MENTDILYVDSATGTGVKVLITALFLIFFGSVTYKLAEYYFKHQDTEEKFDILKRVINKQKKLIKGTLSQQDFDSDPACTMAKTKCFIGELNAEEDESK